MPNPLLTLVDKHFGAQFLPRLKQNIAGLAEDFWKDGNEYPFAFRIGKSSSTAAAKMEEKADGEQKDQNKNAKPSGPAWHAAPGEISEKMWGEGFVAPGGDFIADKMIKPLGLTKEMNVLDLSAGLGGRMRELTAEIGAYVTGLEPDAEIAARGMEMSMKAGKGKHAPIKHYEAALFVAEHTYDCVIARETFYRVPDKTAFLKTIGDCCKPRAQIVFTDYIVNPEDRTKPAIVTWQGKEKGVTPLGLVEMTEAWAMVGINLRVNEDLTEFYVQEVATGLKRLALFLGAGANPDAETKKALMRRIEIWNHRMAAMSEGMKFIRFYGTKQ
jgi:2-polyprenyl-3-methyl-5-hydroxy-6-metoxy-1,4-benzoquinol methylase